MKIREIVTEEQQVDELLGKVARSGVVQKVAGWDFGAAKKLQRAQNAETILQAFSNLGTGFAKLVTRLGVVYVLGDTYFKIRGLDKKLAAKQISPAEYEQQLQAELGYAASQLIAAGLVKTIIGLGGAAIKTMPLLGWPGRFIQWIAGPASAVFLAWLQTPEGSQTFARWFVGAIMEKGITGVGIDFISSYTKKFYDMITMRGDQAEKNLGKTNKDAGQSADSSTTEPADDDFFKKLAAEKPAAGASAQQDFDPATGTWLNKP